MKTASKPRIGFEQLDIGHEHAAVVVEKLTRTQIVQYAGASGDFNPIHHDEVFAKEAAGYPSVFAHGMLTMGLAGKALTNYAGPGQLKSYKARFQSQVWPGDTLTTKLTVTALTKDTATLSLTTRNQKNETVLTATAQANLTT